MTDLHDIFLSYSHNDAEAAAQLHEWFKHQGFTVFYDKKQIQEGELWLDRLQHAVDACGSFVVLVGRDGVGRWVGAETQAALSRYFGPHDEAKRLPIFPILLGNTAPDTLPAFLRLFQATLWNGSDPLPMTLLEQIRHRTLLVNKALVFEGRPFVGLAAYRVDQAQLFFGRQRETLAALNYFGPRPGLPPVRWLEINGNSGSGKSSLMNAGLLPLIDHGWLFSRTGYGQWQRIGPKTSGEHPVVMPMMPGQSPLRMLAEQLAVTFNAEMTDVRSRLQQGDEHTLSEWLRSRKREDTAFLIAIDQFEELFTFADAEERKRFDRLLAAALADADCPLYVISTVRTDFLDRFEADLPRLNAVRGRIGYSWPLPQLDESGLREVIEGPARLVDLDVSEVKEVMVEQARDEPGALPLIENALDWLWEKPEKDPQNGKVRLSGQLFSTQGGLAGILSQNADDLLKSLGKERERALKLLFELVKVDPEGRRHARRRIPLVDAVEIAGGGARGQELVNRLAGQRTQESVKGHGPLRLITVTEEAEAGNPAQNKVRWVNLIHETLIRSKNASGEGKPQPYWPTLWQYIEQHKEQAAQHEHLELLARQWKERKGLARLFGLVGWLDWLGFRKLAVRSSLEQSYLRWSAVRASVTTLILTVLIGILSEAAWWATKNSLDFGYTFIKPLWVLGYVPKPKMVEIPQGDIDGYLQSNETLAHIVTTTITVEMSKYEVTFLEYNTYLWHTQRDNKDNIQYPPDAGFGRFNRPVINVNWHEATAYSAWLGEQTGQKCRLPTEVEWEYAARAGTQTAYPWGDELGSNQANCVGCGSAWDGKMTAPVGSFPPNSFGLHDMSGNVEEWTCSAWRGHFDREEQQCADLKSTVARVVSGGSWRNNPNFVRSSARYYYDPGFRHYVIGFRVLCSSPIDD
jgi:formylglycine-generating enzyme required for sulfatase activity